MDNNENDTKLDAEPVIQIDTDVQNETNVVQNETISPENVSLFENVSESSDKETPAAPA